MPVLDLSLNGKIDVEGVLSVEGVVIFARSDDKVFVLWGHLLGSVGVPLARDRRAYEDVGISRRVGPLRPKLREKAIEQLGCPAMEETEPFIGGYNDDRAVTDKRINGESTYLADDERIAHQSRVSCWYMIEHMHGVMARVRCESKVDDRTVSVFECVYNHLACLLSTDWTSPNESDREIFVVADVAQSVGRTRPHSLKQSEHMVGLWHWRRRQPDHSLATAYCCDRMSEIYHIDQLMSRLIVALNNDIVKRSYK